MSVRKFPMPKHPEGCRWCGGLIYKPRGGPVLEIDKRRSWHDGRGEEPNCFETFFLHTRPDVQRDYLIERDGEACVDCGTDGRRWRARLVLSQRPNPSIGIVDRLETWTPYTVVDRVSGLHVDHAIPLWLVAHLPDEERRAYFGPDNLTLRCPACHNAKTGQEAGERAKGNRLINQDGRRAARSAKSRWPKGRKIPQGRKLR